MRCIPTDLRDAYVLELDLVADARGFFAQTFSQKEFSEHGLASRIVECASAWNKARGTLRGLHYQAPPHAQAKVVRCLRGAVFDVIIDLRPESATYCKWIAVDLTAQNRKMLYVPEGFAHGYETLEPDTEVSYLFSAFYNPVAERAVRWDDPRFQIPWPLANPILSDKDRQHPDFEPRGN
jgi:dTDP-4-dehydrorhamnose 3,5-epimerase